MTKAAPQLHVRVWQADVFGWTAVVWQGRNRDDHAYSSRHPSEADAAIAAVKTWYGR